MFEDVCSSNQHLVKTMGKQKGLCLSFHTHIHLYAYSDVFALLISSKSTQEYLLLWLGSVILKCLCQRSTRGCL